MKIFKHIFHLIPVFALGYVGIFLYPQWVKDGYLEDPYPRIGAFVAVYVGFVGSLLWYIKQRKGL